MVKKKNKKNGSKWFSPSSKPLNWCKKDSQSKRRRYALAARKGDFLATARALQALANITEDNQTRRLSQGDSKYFLKMYHVKNDRKLKKR
jgi:hypothetical protein